MDYSYNYGYLQQFMDSHKLAKKDLLEALGCGDYVSLNKWLDGKVPVHVTAMLRFCNYYNIPLDGFFFDGDGMPAEIRPTLPDSNCQTLPVDGYGIKEGRGRGIVETRITERQISSQAQATVVAEGLARQSEQQHRRDEALMQLEQRTDAGRLLPEAEETSEKAAGTTAGQQNLVETILRMQLEHANEMRTTEREHHEREDRIRRDCQASFDAERNRLMDIIERQNAELSKFYQQGREQKGAKWIAADEPDHK